MADITQHFNDVQQIIEILKTMLSAIQKQTDVVRYPAAINKKHGA